ncbi:MAG TPA: non-homologous end-joining DNA ligase [Nocardioidaceae bacterium]|nr:non-homologous end-joining DNA ligase [Nocardioidaceae bacterium]
MADDVRVDAAGRTLTISHLDKVLYPLSGTTKGEVLHYYAQIAPVLLPHLAGRAVTRIRWPDGTESGRFFEKNLPAGTPSWLRSVRVPSTGSRSGGSGGGSVEFPLVDDLAGLTYLVNLASLELHVHQWRVGGAGRPAKPDRLVIDLDPGAPAGLHECCRVALLVRDRLHDRGLSCAPVTSGSKGLHLYAALPGKLTSEQVRDLAREIAKQLTESHSDLVLWQMTKARRAGKVFLDWSQNTASKTTITPYSLRGMDKPYVAAPRTWEEIEQGAEDSDDADGLRQLTADQVLRRVDDEGDIFGAQLDV